jgi:HEPN domain-containing protein
VNDGLSQGRYFFMDIAGDGIALYQSDGRELAEPKPQTPAQALTVAKEYFEEWLPSAQEFYETAQFARRRGWTKKAAFLLHQATESYYNCLLLVRLSYTPHVHNIGFLRSQAERIDSRLFDVWPREARRQRAMFQKLKESYVQARYSKNFRINEDELAWLTARVEELGRVVEMVCSARLEELERSVE